MNNQGDLLVYRGCTPVVDSEYDIDGGSPAAEAITWALADAIGVDPTAVPPLFDYVEPDALNALFARAASGVDGETVLSFQVDTWNVFVRSDGCIRVCDATRPTEPEPIFEPTTA